MDNAMKRSGMRSDKGGKHEHNFVPQMSEGGKYETCEDCGVSRKMKTSNTSNRKLT
jgi:hypothetical protein